MHALCIKSGILTVRNKRALYTVTRTKLQASSSGIRSDVMVVLEVRQSPDEGWEGVLGLTFVFVFCEKITMQPCRIQSVNAQCYKWLWGTFHLTGSLFNLFYGGKCVMFKGVGNILTGNTTTHYHVRSVWRMLQGDIIWRMFEIEIQDSGSLRGCHQRVKGEGW